MTAACVAAGGAARVLSLSLTDASYHGTSARGFSIGGSSGSSLNGDIIFSAICSSSPGTIDDEPIQIDWLTNGAPANYDIKVTLNSGSLTSGTTGSWLNLGSSQTWTTTSTAALGVEIGYTGAASALVSCTVTLAP